MSDGEAHDVGAAVRVLHQLQVEKTALTARHHADEVHTNKRRVMEKDKEDLRKVIIESGATLEKGAVPCVRTRDGMCLRVQPKVSTSVISNGVIDKSWDEPSIVGGVVASVMAMAEAGDDGTPTSRKRGRKGCAPKGGRPAKRAKITSRKVGSTTADGPVVAGVCDTEDPPGIVSFNLADVLLATFKTNLQGYIRRTVENGRLEMKELGKMPKYIQSELSGAECPEAVQQVYDVYRVHAGDLESSAMTRRAEIERLEERLESARENLNLALLANHVHVPVDDEGTTLTDDSMEGRINIRRRKYTTRKPPGIRVLDAAVTTAMVDGGLNGEDVTVVDPTLSNVRAAVEAELASFNWGEARDAISRHIDLVCAVTITTRLVVRNEMEITTDEMCEEEERRTEPSMAEYYSWAGV